MGRKESLLRLYDILIKRRDALRRALTEDLSPLHELGEEKPEGDVVDFALDTANDEISSQLVEADSRELSQIEEALERFREGTYGVCEVTGKPIPLERLRALPYTTMTIEAQRMIEEEGFDSLPHKGNWGRLEDGSGGDKDVSINDIEMEFS
ncbi:RNA polymerase-binding transcription factor DksA [Planctomycetales bacterium 10988]|nr:RNA polymerase-binding transcription factor DksA [Planctomycetales bacterium 10988]